MKKITSLIAVFLTALLLNSCSSGSDSSEPIVESDLVATWILQSRSIDGDALSNTHDIMSFFANHRMKVTYPLDGNAVENGGWTLDGNNLTIHWDEADAGLEYYHTQILTLTATDLKWKSTISGEGVLTENYTKE